MTRAPRTPGSVGHILLGPRRWRLHRWRRRWYPDSWWHRYLLRRMADEANLPLSTLRSRAGLEPWPEPPRRVPVGRTEPETVTYLDGTGRVIARHPEAIVHVKEAITAEQAGALADAWRARQAAADAVLSAARAQAAAEHAARRRRRPDSE